MTRPGTLKLFTRLLLSFLPLCVSDMNFAFLKLSGLGGLGSRSRKRELGAYSKY